MDQIAFPPPDLGRESPTESDVRAIQLGVRRYGLAGLIKRVDVAWSVVGGAGFGYPVKAESLHSLRAALLALNLYQTSV